MPGLSGPNLIGSKFYVYPTLELNQWTLLRLEPLGTSKEHLAVVVRVKEL